MAQIDADGFRNGPQPAQKPSDEFWIGLFGGSAAFSSAASDNRATIASQLERRLNLAGFGAGRRVRVVDLSLPACQQPQQLLICLLNLDRLDGVVTFDGVNEVVVPGFYNVPSLAGAFPYRPIYEALYARGITEEQVALSWLRQERIACFERRPKWWQAATKRRHKVAVERLSTRLREGSGAAVFRTLFPVPEQTPTEAIARGVRRWQTCLEQMHGLCEANGLRALFTIQPIPDHGKTLTSREVAHLDAHREAVDLRRGGYSLILERADELQRRHFPVVPLTDVFSTQLGDVYTDLIHFEDLGCRLVAERIAALIVERWR